MFWWRWQVALSVMYTDKDLKSIIYESDVHQLGKLFQLWSVEHKQGNWAHWPLFTVRKCKRKSLKQYGGSGDSTGSEVKSGQASSEFLCLSLNRREQEQDVSWITLSWTESKAGGPGEVTDQSAKPRAEWEKITTRQPPAEMLIKDDTQSG